MEGSGRGLLKCTIPIFVENPKLYMILFCVREAEKYVYIIEVTSGFLLKVIFFIGLARK
jgi:hypothetical protein